MLSKLLQRLFAFWNRPKRPKEPWCWVILKQPDPLFPRRYIYTRMPIEELKKLRRGKLRSFDEPAEERGPDEH